MKEGRFKGKVVGCGFLAGETRPDGTQKMPQAYVSFSLDLGEDGVTTMSHFFGFKDLSCSPVCCANSIAFGGTLSECIFGITIACPLEIGFISNIAIASSFSFIL